MKPHRPLSIREKGLRQHLGEAGYRNFVEHYEYQMNNYGKPNYTQLKKATGWSRQTLYTYVDIYREEQDTDR